MWKLLKTLFGPKGPASTEPAKTGQSKIEHVEAGYKGKTASTSAGGFRSEQDLQQFIRQSFKFTDYVIEGIRCANLDRKYDGKVYEVYHCQSRSKALEFLRSIPSSQIPPLYYIIVETPQGNLGKDLQVIFDEASGQEIG